MDPEERWSAQEILDHKYFDLVRDLDEPPEVCLFVCLFFFFFEKINFSK